MAPTDTAEQSSHDSNPSASPKKTSSAEMEASEVRKTPGPLITMFDQAASSPLMQRVDQKVPAEVRPVLSRGASHTRKVLNSLDEAVVVAKDTLDTDEGKELASASCAFARSLIAFIRVLYSSALAAVERRMGMESNDDNGLANRSICVGRHIVSKVSTAMNEREEEVTGTCEAQIYSYIRYAIGFMTSMFAVILNSLAGFKGPGSSYISPAAKQVIDYLPDDIRKAVTEKGDLSEVIDEFRRSSTTAPTDS